MKIRPDYKPKGDKGRWIEIVPGHLVDGVLLRKIAGKRKDVDFDVRLVHKEEARRGGWIGSYYVLVSAPGLTMRIWCAPKGEPIHVDWRASDANFERSSREKTRALERAEHAIPCADAFLI